MKRRVRKDLLAIGGLLAVAGAFALLAQHFARRGDWAGSLVTSVLSMAVLVYVILRAWPNLPRPGLAYHLTRNGLLYILAVFVVAAAALSSANNLLFLVLAGMLAALLVSGLFSRLNLAELELQYVVPDDLFAGQETPVRLLLRNLKSWMPSFSIWLRAELPLEGEAPDVYFPVLAGGQTSSMMVSLCFPRRGRYYQEVFWLRSGFPFGFLVKSVRLQLPRELLVYPPVTPRAELDASLRHLTHQWEVHRAGLGQDLYRIRPYQTGDSARVVHWKASAHTGDLKVREFSVEEDHRVELVFDRAVPAGAEWRDRFEKAVELCASLAWRLRGRGAEVRFQPDGLEDVYDILRYLALVEPLEGGPPMRVEPSGMFQVIFSASAARLAASLPESSYYCYDLENL